MFDVLALVLRGFFQVAPVAASTYFVSHDRPTWAVGTGFLISLLWWTNAGTAAPLSGLGGARVQFEPGVVRVRVRVVPHAVNRGVTVAAISEGFTRSSYEQLDGLQAPITRWIEWRDVPAGEYDVIAHLSPARAAERATVS